MASKIRWADTLDDDDVKEIPVGSVSGPDAKGVKTVVEYRKNEKGEIVKVTTRIKTSTIEKRVYKVCGDTAQRSLRICAGIVLCLQMRCRRCQDQKLSWCILSPRVA